MNDPIISYDTDDPLEQELKELLKNINDLVDELDAHWQKIKSLDSQNEREKQLSVF